MPPPPSSVEVVVEVVLVVVSVEVVLVGVVVVVLVVVGAVVEVVGIVVDELTLDESSSPLSEAITARATPRPMTTATRIPIIHLVPLLIPPPPDPCGSCP